MTYQSRYLRMSIALSRVLRTRGEPNFKRALREALREGSIIAAGMVQRDWTRKKPAAWLDKIPSCWWWHTDFNLKGAVIHFERAETDPPTPFRIEKARLPRDRFDELWPDPTKSEETFTDDKRGDMPHQTGTAGRPSSRDLITRELNRLAKEGPLPTTLSEMVEVLRAWLQATYPNAPCPKAKSLQNSIRSEYNRLKKEFGPTIP